MATKLDKMLHYKRMYLEEKDKHNETKKNTKNPKNHLK